MNTQQIDRLVRAALDCCGEEEGGSAPKEGFAGVFAADQLPPTLFRPGERRVCIVNSEPQNKRGQHWFVLGIDARKAINHYGFVFDSLGAESIQKRGFESAYFEKFPSLKYVLKNRFPTQDQSVDSCALHAIYFLLLLTLKGMKFENAVNKFDLEWKLNNDCQLLNSFNEFMRCKSFLKLIEQLKTDLADTYHRCASLLPRSSFQKL